MSDEQERAQKFVERHFPAAAAFLAVESGEGEPPVFGPTGVQNAHDDQPEPYVVVNVAYRLGRFELFAALADGYATTNTGVDPDGMTVEEIRSDVEAYLSGASWRDMESLVETVAGRIENGAHPEQMQALKRAMDRAYPVRPAPERAPGFAAEFPHVAAHLARERGESTVTVETLDHGQVTFAEPAWCLGHDGERPGYRVDITHNGSVTAAKVETACHGEVEFLQAHLSWAPFAELQPEPFPIVAIEVDQGHDFDPPGVRMVARELRRHADRLEQLADELAMLRLGGPS